MNDHDHGKPPFRVIDGEADDRPPPAPADEAEPVAVNDEAVLMKIQALEEEHRDLDTAILSLEERMPYDRLTLQRMKKRKLQIKDRIRDLRAGIQPDIIA